MNFEEKYASNSEEKILIRKIDDLIKRSEKNYTALYSHFLTPAEQTLLIRIEEFYGQISFDGGYDEAERRICRVCAQDYAEDPGLPVELFQIKATSASAEISHRDVLGALMGSGIKREMIGDILTDNNNAWFFCHRIASDYIEINLTSVGKYRIEINRSELYEIPESKMEHISINVSSMRLDSICSECFGLSRTKAAEIIRKGMVSLNWLVCDNVSKEIVEGDKISMRGKGKVRIGPIKGMSKKGRLFVEADKYI